MQTKYRSLWLWMIIPMVLMQLAIAMDYWGDFSRNTWAVHIHYWNATLWYAFLISQPWLYSSGRIEAHRNWGLVGLLLAGGMVFLSVGQLNRDIVYANFARDNPGGMGPFEPWFFFQVMLIEMVLISAFIVAIFMAIFRRRSLEDHSWWMASTAFLILMPALGRGLQNLWIGIYGFVPEAKRVLTEPIYLCQVIIILLTLGYAWRLGKLRHPATFLAVGANATLFVIEPIARSTAVQEFFRAAIAH